MPRRLAFLIALLGLLALPLGGSALAASPQGSHAGTATVTVLHGVPGLTVDVYVNDQLTLKNFAPGTVTDPLTLPAGSYDIAIRPAGAAADTAPAIAGSATLEAGANVSIIAHLTAGGTPTLSVFANDVSPLGAGQSRLVVRHTAAAPAVDIWANGNVLFGNLSNPNQAMADVPAGSYAVQLAAAGTQTIAFDAGQLTLQPGTAYVVYATGSLSDGSFGLLVQTIGDLSAAQAAMPAEAKSGCVYFESTKHNACGGFAAYWSHYGGLDVYGYPLTEEFQQNGMTVQYFQRARFEWHPGAAPQRYDVLLGLVGNEWSAADGLQSGAAFQPVDGAPSSDCAYFSATQHSACGAFAAYWTTFGGLPVFGYPISEPFVDQNGTHVQYFERARMELRDGVWPERHDIELGLLGDQLLMSMHAS